MAKVSEFAKTKAIITQLNCLQNVTVAAILLGMDHLHYFLSYWVVPSHEVKRAPVEHHYLASHFESGSLLEHCLELRLVIDSRFPLALHSF